MGAHTRLIALGLALASVFQSVSLLVCRVDCAHRHDFAVPVSASAVVVGEHCHDAEHGTDQPDSATPSTMTAQQHACDHTPDIVLTRAEEQTVTTAPSFVASSVVPALERGASATVALASPAHAPPDTPARAMAVLRI